MNLQQYADHRQALGLRGATHVSVLRAIKAGRLMPPAVKRQGKGWEIDPALADEQWAQATDPAPRGTNASQGQGPRPKTATTEGQVPTTKQDQQPALSRPLRPPAPALADDSPEPAEIPSYNDSRARSEFEKANILEMDRKAKANTLLPREDVEQAWDSAVNLTRTVMLGVPSKAKQRIPHLTPDEVALLMDLIREALSGLAAGDVMELYPEVEP